MADMSMEDFLKQLDIMKDDVIENVAVSVTEVAEDLLNTSAQLAPLDEGGLMESGSVDPARLEGNKFVAQVGYNKEYSLRMHEGIYNIGATSASKPSVEGMTVGRKFLEQPVIQKGEKYAEHIAKKMGDIING